MERGNALVVLRSLLWPGLTFYHAPRTKNYGYIYVGTGEKNLDLPFMLWCWRILLRVHWTAR